MANSPRALPPLDLLRGFESAARHLSFTRAAAELFLTQSAVSRQIQALEEFVGAPLFERRHKSLVLTEPGQAYYRVVAGALEQLREATRKLRDVRRGHVLTVTTTVSFASTWLVPRLQRFRRDHPGIDVRITADPRGGRSRARGHRRGGARLRGERGARRIDPPGDRAPGGDVQRGVREGGARAEAPAPFAPRTCATT
jgi:DNA-binding transcriptional LysR family regulator